MSKAPQKSPLVSVIILNWNRPQDTVECIRSVKQQSYTHFEIIVLDNGSADNSLVVLRKIKGVKLVENPVNRGFTGGHIDGLKEASGEYIFILNNDAVIDKDYIQNAVTILNKDSRIAVVGGRSYQWETPDQLYQDTSPFYAFQTIDRFSMEGIFARTDAGFDHEVNWVSGSAMVMRKSVLDITGYFFDPMFAYYEESDLFARIQAHDFSIVYSPSLKIWHKIGASSSSYFQYKQLFKNRFVYGMRNLESQDLIRFIHSYTKTAVRGSYYHLLQRSKTDNEKVLNRALFASLGHSLVYWPKWSASRKSVRLKDSHDHNLSDRLTIEQTGISFVCDVSRNIRDITKLVPFIQTTAYRHFRSQFVIVCKYSEVNKLNKLLEKYDISKYPITVIGDTHQSRVNPLNIGWLSAIYDLVWFISPKQQPSTAAIATASLAAYSQSFSYHTESPESFCVSRRLLSLYGGIDSMRLTEASDHLQYFEKRLKHKKNIHNNVVPSDVKAKVASIIYTLKTQRRQSNRYQKLLDRYYRLYQLNNLAVWLFVKDISHRHKLARIRNTVLASLQFKRKELAIELKHINNEVVRSQQAGFNHKQRDAVFLDQANMALIGGKWKNTPIFIICRDRVSPLRELIAWLEKADMTNIILIDNGSIYPDLLKFFSSTPYQVIRTGKNIGHTVVWAEGFAKTLFPDKYYIVTDPDVIPDDDAPLNAVEYFYRLHIRYEHFKVGFGLQIDDLPNHYILKPQVIEWERQFWKIPLENEVYEAAIDTTFALYKPFTDLYTLHPSIRTGRPYTAKHLPWYVDSSKIDEEEAFYRMHASQDITSWNTDEVLERYKKEFKK